MWNTPSCTKVRQDLNYAFLFILVLVFCVDTHRLIFAEQVGTSSSVTSINDSHDKPDWSEGTTASEFIVVTGLDSQNSSVRLNGVRNAPFRRVSRRNAGRVKPSKVHGWLENEKAIFYGGGDGSDNSKNKRLVPLSDEAKKALLYERKKRDTAENDKGSQDDGIGIEELETSDSKVSTSSEQFPDLIKNFTLSFLESFAREKDEISPRTDGTGSRNLKSSDNAAPSLQQLLLSHLVRGILSVRNSTASGAANRTSSRNFPIGFKERSETMTPAEQRQYGIIVSPHPLSGLRSSVPVVRVLKGKLISLPQIPPELIPILLGTYNPTYTNADEHKLTENIIDSAIYTLLQNEDLLNLNLENLYPRNNRVRLGNISNRKSPSTNYAGSLKAHEPVAKPTFRPLDFQSDWISGPRCDRLTEEICLDDSDYPSSAIMSSIYKDKAKFDLMYAEIKERKSQVEGLNRKQELAYDYTHYFGQASQTAETVRPLEYGPRGGFVCPSEVHYGRPHRAKNRKGEWKVVVNVGDYTQTLRMERCLVSGNQCKYVVSHMQSQCSQVYSYHRLLVFNKDQGLHIDIFRIPSGCTCHLRGKNYFSQPHMSVRDYEEFSSHVEGSPSSQLSDSASNDKRKKTTFSDTLWAILGGGRQAGTLAQSPQFLDEVKKQISWAQTLQQFPQFYKQVSPEQVLKQLLEEEEEQRTAAIKPTILKIHRYKNDRDSTNAYATHHVPVTVPLREAQAVLPARNIQRVPIPRPIHLPSVSQTDNASPDGMKRFELLRRPIVFNDAAKEPGFMRSDIYPEITTLSEDGQVTDVEVTSTVTEVPYENPQTANSLDTAEYANDESVGMSTTTSEPTSTTSTESTERMSYNKDLFDFAKPDNVSDSSQRNDTEEIDNKDNENEKVNFSYHPILEYLSL